MEELFVSTLTWFMATPFLFTTALTLSFRGLIVHGGTMDNLVSVPEQNGGIEKKKKDSSGTNRRTAID